MTLNTMKILIYSPNKDVRESIKLLLARQYDLILTDSPDQCKECIKNATINLVIAEISNPISEKNWLEEIKSQSKNIPIILLIPHKYEKDKRIKEFIQIVDKYLYIKPIKEEALQNILKQLKI